LPIALRTRSITYHLVRLLSAGAEETTSSPPLADLVDNPLCTYDKEEITKNDKNEICSSIVIAFSELERLIYRLI
jgi:hypothetical protein